MNFKRSLIFTIFVIILSNSVVAIEEFYVDLALEPFCYDDGSATLYITNQGTKGISVQDISVTYSHSKNRVISNDLQGTWEADRITNDDTLRYKVLPGSIKEAKEQGFLIFKLEYKECDNEPCLTAASKTCEKSQNEISPTSYFCRYKKDFVIESCYNNESRFIAILSNIGKNNSDELKYLGMGRDLSYWFWGTKSSYGSFAQNMPADTLVKNIGDDRYEFSFTTNDKIKRMWIESHICGEEAYQQCTESAFSFTKEFFRERGGDIVIQQIGEKKETKTEPTIQSITIEDQEKQDYTQEILIGIFVLLAIFGIIHFKRKSVK